MKQITELLLKRGIQKESTTEKHPLPGSNPFTETVFVGIIPNGKGKEVLRVSVLEDDNTTVVGIKSVSADGQSQLIIHTPSEVMAQPEILEKFLDHYKVQGIDITAKTKSING